MYMYLLARLGKRNASVRPITRAPSTGRWVGTRVGRNREGEFGIVNKMVSA